MKTVAIIQARMGSTRLPGKIMRLIGNLPLYKIVYNRVSSSKLIDQVVFATTTNSEDDYFCEELEKSSIHFFRGSDADVLLRFQASAKYFDADNIVRITCDDPFKDPQIIDQCVEQQLKKKYDFSTNIIEPSFAEGMDVECFSRDLLEEMNISAHKAYQREHVTPYFYENISRFSYFSLKDTIDMSSYRLTLDDPIDLMVLTDLYQFADFDYTISYSELKKIIKNEEFRKRLVGRVPAYEGLSVSKGN